VPGILFLCTGNYYRSRFAEALWNHLEAEAPIGWQADSRGLRLSLGTGNVGSISALALDGLRQRGVVLPAPIRPPRQATNEDFAVAACAVAVSGAEHRPMMVEHFSRWAQAVEYWDVEDVGLCDPALALQLLDGGVRALRGRLAAARGREPTAR
jgi:protein-tyrosine phosphatase